MNFVPEANASEILAMFRSGAGLLGWKTWDTRVDQLKRMVVDNPFAQQLILARHSIELGYSAIRSHYRATNRLSWPPSTVDEYRFVEFLVGFYRTYNLLSNAGKHRLVGSVKSGLDQDSGLEPLSFEFQTAVHFAQRGFNIRFHDLEEGGGFDLLLSQGDLSVEVECKHLSNDVGMQIHDKQLCGLGRALWGVFKNTSTRNAVTIFDISLPGRLDAGDFEQIQSAVAAAAKSKQKVQLTACTVSVRTFPVDPSTFSKITTAHAEQIKELVEREFGGSFPHMLLKASNENAVIAGIRSEKQNVVLERIYRNMIADSKRQFSGKRPALLMLKLPQISNQEMIDLQRAEGAGPTGIQKTASAILNKRKKLCAVALVPFSEIRQFNNSVSAVRTASVKSRGEALIYWNDRCEFPQVNGKARMFFASPDG